MNSSPEQALMLFRAIHNSPSLVRETGGSGDWVWFDKTNHWVRVPSQIQTILMRESNLFCDRLRGMGLILPSRSMLSWDWDLMGISASVVRPMTFREG